MSPTYYNAYNCRPTYAWVSASVSTTITTTTASIADDFVYFIAGETIAVRDAVFVKDDELIYRATALSVTASFDIGFAVSGAVSGATIPVDTKHGKLLDGFSGLQVGSRYFLSESYGAIATTSPENTGSMVYQVGIAKSSDKLLLYPELLVRK